MGEGRGQRSSAANANNQMEKAVPATVGCVQEGNCHILVGFDLMIDPASPLDFRSS